MKKNKKPYSKTLRIIMLGGEETEERVLMRQRWRQILIHSCIYYKLNESLVTDKQWDTWANELVELRDKYPGIAGRMIFPHELMSFNPATGFDLPLSDPSILLVAEYLVKCEKLSNKKETEHGKLLGQSNKRNRKQKPRPKSHRKLKG